jgi:prepilin-type N-terminal cleavage/methylation domain-containing protein
MKKAFTLLEMILVLVIMGIITLMIMGLTGTQLQKLQQKTVKDTLLTAYQNRYSKNLTSSFFAGERYKKMTITFTSGSNEVQFAYFTGESTDAYFSDTFQGDFEVVGISNGSDVQFQNEVRLDFQPYEIPCTINSGDNRNEAILLITMKQQKEYAFSISSKSCRMREIKSEK